MLLLALPLAGGRCWRLLFLLLGILWMQVNLHYRLAWLDQLGKKTSHIITAHVQSAESSGEKEGDKFGSSRLSGEGRLDFQKKVF